MFVERGVIALDAWVSRRVVRPVLALDETDQTLFYRWSPTPQPTQVQKLVSLQPPPYQMVQAL
ncbi:hypothetical protein [Leptolyngbya sp. CCY15150]|uniref:hypothetical protein n=1 Tax=Leptolyngbya sp. CCY15150 TaxID=2767772 RepID=UPI00194FBA78|nr:hypothetical protein [Leptolyngbya sp. CCY15150]